MLSSTGKYCFTFNKEDECFAQWNVDPLILEDSLADTETPIQDFMSVIPEKNRSKMFEDIKDYFCYVQIERGATSLSKTIPTEDICNICRAMGFSPTDKEIEDMVNEVCVCTHNLDESFYLKLLHCH